jgi:hypothetical protein
MDAHAVLKTARAAFDARDRDYVAELLRTLVLQQPSLGESWDTVARMASAIGEVEVAVAAHRSCILATTEKGAAHSFALAKTLLRYGRVREAAQVGEHLVESAPGLADAHHLLGETLAQTHDVERAIFHLRTALHLMPEAPMSWLVLATIKQFSTADPELEKLRSICSRARPAAASRGVLHYALGKALDDVGDLPAAFTAFSEGARLTNLARHYDRLADATLLEQATSRLDGDFFGRLTPSASANARAIFIVGMPRSGTTLVEHILNAHSEVAGGGELGSFRQAAMALTDFLPDSLSRFDASRSEAWTSLAHSYGHLLEQRFGSSGRIIDKTLVHTKYLGVLAHALPRAQFIWMKRDPVATAWSCFRTHFGSGQNWSWTWDDLAYYCHLQDRLHEHWKRHFPSRILTVPHEEFVRDSATWIPRILAHAGLTDERGLGEARIQNRAVQTASTAQVRRPIDIHLAGRWRAYESFMGEFRRAYERYSS